MSEDWRVRVTFNDPEDGRRAVRELHEHEVADDVRGRLRSRVAVSVSDPDLYLYTNTRDASLAASTLVREVLMAHDLRAAVRIDYWHAVEEDWVRLDEAALETAVKNDTSAEDVPDDAEVMNLERQYLEDEQEVPDSQRGSRGALASWEVRVDLPSHHDAVAFARQLKEAGHPPIRRWKYLLVGARNEAEANALAEMIRRDGPAGLTAHALPVPYSAAALGSASADTTVTSYLATF
jgi:hypothetical protein